MPSEVGIKLTGDNSDLIAKFHGSVDEAGKFAGEISGKVADKLTGLKDISSAIATALGINLTALSEGLARTVLGFSKQQEEALKRIAELSADTADKNIATMRAVKSEEQRYQSDLRQRDKILRDIKEANDAIQKAQAGYIDEYEGLKHSAEELKKNEERRVQISELENKLAEVGANIKEHELKLRDEALKKAEDIRNAELEGLEKQQIARLDLLSAEQKIEALKTHIASMEAAIANQLIEEKDVQLLSKAIQEAKNLVVAEEVKLRKEETEIEKKNNDAAEDAAQKRIDRARAELPLVTQRSELLQNIETLNREIAAGEELGFDVTKQVKELDEKRAQLKEVEKKQTQENVEIAKLLLKPVTELTKSDQLRLEILTNQTTQQKVNKEIADIIAKGAANLTDADKSRLAVLTGQSDELQHQIEKLKEVQALTIEIRRTGSSYENQSTASLEGARERVKAQLDQVRQQNAIAPRSQRNPIEAALASEYQQITDELNARKNVSSYASRLGEDAARAKYGDTLTDRALRATQDATTRTATAVEKLQQQLQQAFKLPPL